MCLAPEEKLELKDKSLKPVKKQKRVSFSIKVGQEEKGTDKSTDKSISTTYNKLPTIFEVDDITPTITITKNETKNDNTYAPDKILPICFMLQEYKIHLDKSREYILELNKQLTELKQQLLESQKREQILNAKINIILTSTTSQIHNNLINNLSFNKDMLITTV
jgi:CRISPR/Cas system CMR-associated protein Cmr5 small subunit